MLVLGFAFGGKSTRRIMGIDKNLLPIKAHFFFFMAASGPVLPYLTVYGKEMGISEVVMGTVTAVVPLTFLLAKPVFGFLVDSFYEKRKQIFMVLVACLGVFYGCLYFVPPVDIRLKSVLFDVSGECDETSKEYDIACNATCPPAGCLLAGRNSSGKLCFDSEGCAGVQVPAKCRDDCLLQTLDDESRDEGYPFRFLEFYVFIGLMTACMILFNVGNSVSDAVCFDALGEGKDDRYGYQRVWGTIGFGAGALLGGVGTDLLSGGGVDYTFAFVLVAVFTALDVFCCSKLKLPKISTSENILKDLWRVMQNGSVALFLVFATLVGILDGFFICFLFWFLEDLAAKTGQTQHVKVLEGLTVAAETFGGEVVFFPLSGKILNKIGFGHALTLCFFNYALRLGLVSFVTNPWWIVGIELFLQGPTYALCYTTIVAYANAISPPGASATMQGIVAGMDDGFGYALGSLIGGFLYKAVGGPLSFRIMSLVAFSCCIFHFILHKFVLSKFYLKRCVSDYKPPGEATQMVSASKPKTGIQANI